MNFVDTREEAIQKRRSVKASGCCSCFTKLIHGGYYVGNCPRNLCKPKREVSEK